MALAHLQEYNFVYLKGLCTGECWASSSYPLAWRVTLLIAGICP